MGALPGLEKGDFYGKKLFDRLNDNYNRRVYREKINGWLAQPLCVRFSLYKLYKKRDEINSIISLVERKGEAALLSSWKDKFNG